MTSRMQRVFCWAAAVSVVTGVWAGCQSGPEPADDEEPMMVGSAPVDEASQVVEEAATGAEGQAPSRIIFFIGDGMGISSVTAAAYAEGRVLNMLGMPQFGAMATHGYEFVTTDSDTRTLPSTLFEGYPCQSRRASTTTPVAHAP